MIVDVFNQQYNNSYFSFLMINVVNVRKSELNKRGIKDFENWNNLSNTIYIHTLWLKNTIKLVQAQRGNK